MPALKPAVRRRIASGLTLWVIGWQIALIAAFLLDPSDPPRIGGSLGQALWALAHKPAFYPLVFVALTGPPITWLAMAHKGPHRGSLIVAWIVFTIVIGVFFMDRVWVMVQVLMRHGAG